MAHNDAVLLMGEFGRYQRRTYLLLCLPAICSAFHFMAGVFLAAKTDFRCLLPNENAGNATYQLPPDIANMHNFQQWVNKTKGSECESYDVNFADQYFEADGKPDNKKCDSFVYDKSTYKLTTTTEFNLVCNQDWMRAIAESFFMVGVMLGAIIFGALSDRFGRRPIYCLTILIHLISGFLVAASPEYISFTILRLIVAAAVTGTFSIAYVAVVEMVGPKKRLMAVIGFYLSFTLGYILTAGLAYCVTNWRILQIVITIPSIGFLVYWWFIPESVRWLLAKGRFEEAKNLLLKASLENGVELSPETLENAITTCIVANKLVCQKSSMFDLMRYPNLRRKSLLLFFSWFVISGTYYGLSWNTSNLGGNDYINFVISASVEIPAHLFVLFTLNRWGRKPVLCGCMLFAGTSLLLTTVVPADMPWLVVALAMSGKSAITGSFGSIYIFTTEQFPTAIRNVGLGSCSTFARIAGLLVPYINYTSTIWIPMPLVIFGTCSLMAGLLVLLLPETLGEKLPETIEDGEQFGKRTLQLEKISRN